MLIEFRLIKHALALARFRNFARAAEALHLTQPSLSRSIATLERALGVQLFDRDKKGIRPTVFGELVLARGAALIGGEADLRREIQLLAGLEAGELAIGAGPYPTEISVSTAVIRLLRAHPRLRVHVITASPNDIARRVLAGEFDVGVVNPMDLVEAPRLVVEPLAEHAAYFACRPGHPLAGARDLTLAQILQFPLATTTLPSTAAEAAAGFDRAGTVDVRTGSFTPAVHVNTLALARQIARGSDALFPAPMSMLAEDIAAGRLVRLDFHIPAMRTTYGLVTLRDRSLSPAANAFIRHVRDVEEEIVRSEAPAAAETPRRRTASPARRTRSSTKSTSDPSISEVPT